MILGSSGGIPSHDMIYELENQLTQARIQNWIHHDLLSYQWWILLAVLFIPWLLWWKWVDKTRLIEIALYGAITLVSASFLDAILSELCLWDYHFYVIPLWPRLISADFSVIPVTYMFIYQYFQEWKGFLFALLIISVIFAFAGEPLLVWLNIYTLHGWKHFYSLPLYFVLGVLVKYLNQWLLTHNE